MPAGRCGRRRSTRPAWWRSRPRAGWAARCWPRAAAAGPASPGRRILAGAHDFRELRLLAALAAGQPVLPAPLDAEARQLVGGDGVGLPARLGLTEEPTVTGLRYAIVGALRRWRDHAENPVLDETA